MTGKTNGIAIEMIPVDRITVLNPRVRDKKKFLEIVDSIAKVGLKQPIKVRRAESAESESAYALVYGQGRLEAFIALGEKEIPAIVAEVSEEDSLVMSLVENIARRQHRPIELLRDIAGLNKRGYSDAEIARKIGFSGEYVRCVRRLLEKGEERLLVGVETGQMPINVAMAIAKADEENAQQVLAEAYEKGLLVGKQVTRAKRLIEERGRRGKAHVRSPSVPGRRRPSAGALVRALTRQTELQRLMIKRAEITRSRLLFLVEAMQLLMDDENFVTLLRAEGMYTMPRPLAEQIAARGMG